jgi:hypothetical protein
VERTIFFSRTISQTVDLYRGLAVPVRRTLVLAVSALATAGCGSSSDPTTEVAGQRCIYVTAEVSGPPVGFRQVAEARDRAPLVVVRADLTLP